MTQCQAILEYLQAHPEGITQLESFNALGVCRLSERIRELERQGYVFEHMPVAVPARDGRTARVVRYRYMFHQSTISQEKADAMVAYIKRRTA